jgi:hypothetical protein
MRKSVLFFAVCAVRFPVHIHFPVLIPSLRSDYFSFFMLVVSVFFVRIFVAKISFSHIFSSFCSKSHARWVPSWFWTSSLTVVSGQFKVHFSIAHSSFLWLLSFNSGPVALGLDSFLGMQRVGFGLSRVIIRPSVKRLWVEIYIYTRTRTHG